MFIIVIACQVRCELLSHLSLLLFCKDTRKRNESDDVAFNSDEGQPVVAAS